MVKSPSKPIANNHVVACAGSYNPNAPTKLPVIPRAGAVVSADDLARSSRRQPLG